jgi:prolyl-tRNA synthetase
MAEDYMAMPVITGEKTESEKFPGAETTTCIEAMMQDRKALQAGTSHFLGQNFAKASDIRFQNDQEMEEYAWTTSWGVSTRLIGGLIMTHGDDNGIILPPRIASAHVALLPIIRSENDKATVMEYTNQLASRLREQTYYGRNIVVEIDERSTGGTRNWEWIKKGIPLRLEIGPKDIAKDAVFAGRRDKDARDRFTMQKDHFVSEICMILDDIQNALYHRALSMREENTRTIDDMADFEAFFTPKNAERPEIHGGFALSHWCGDAACEQQIKEKLTVTIRCIPYNIENETRRCIACGKESKKRVVFAKAY